MIAAEARAEAIRLDSELAEPVELPGMRSFEPGELVRARLELSRPGRVRRPGAGLDVRGDGAVVPFRGSVFKRQLPVRRGRSPYDAVRAALGEDP